MLFALGTMRAVKIHDINCSKVYHLLQSVSLVLI
jgi:hypothetical protein